MELVLTRFKNGDRAALGALTVDGVFLARTVEDVVRELGPRGEGKVQDQTAIPAGRYRVTIETSPKFQKKLPRLHDVPFFSGILIHAGNTHTDTKGCILVGGEHQGETIKGGTSTPAFKSVAKTIQTAINRQEPVWIRVVDAFPEPKKGGTR